VKVCRLEPAQIHIVPVVVAANEVKVWLKRWMGLKGEITERLGGR
jgi:hypothetical protein